MDRLIPAFLAVEKEPEASKGWRINVLISSKI
jgi:hypothetical protein